MKLHRNTYIFLFQLLILLLFLMLTLLNEEYDLPYHLLGDPPVSIQHRHGEMIIELTFFFFVVVAFFMINTNLLKKIKYYEKQKEILERTFYHDIRNTAVVLDGFARLLQKSPPEKAEKYKKVIYLTSQQLIEEIETQRDISHAEKNELAIHPQQINSFEILNEIIEQYKDHSLSKNRKLIINDSSNNVDLISDKTIIKRVLGNMVKNALEACHADETITLGCIVCGDEIEFQVHNPNFISKEVKGRIFQFSFSTKGQGRGLGTYSMKLLSEKFLKGKISFHTSEKEGTIFKARYPLQYKK